MNTSDFIKDKVVRVYVKTPKGRKQCTSPNKLAWLLKMYGTCPCNIRYCPSDDNGNGRWTDFKTNLTFWDAMDLPWKENQNYRDEAKDYTLPPNPENNILEAIHLTYRVHAVFPPNNGFGKRIFKSPQGVIRIIAITKYADGRIVGTIPQGSDLEDQIISEFKAVLNINHF